MKRLLPISSPEVTSYSHHTTVLSIISTNKSYLPWFCSNYIQLCVAEDLQQQADLDFFFPAKYSANLPISPFLQVQQITHEVQAFCRFTILEFIENCIHSEIYVYIVLNCSYIQQYAAPIHHSIFIYGYDSEAREFHCGDFFREGVYQFKTISYDEVELAYSTIEPSAFWWNGMKLLKHLPTAEYEFDVSFVKDLLTDYLYGNDSSLRLRAEFTSYKNPEYGTIKFGLESVYQRLNHDNASLQGEVTGVYDPRALPVFTDHKKALLLVMQYMINNNYLKSESVLNVFEGIYKETFNLRNLNIKYNISQNAAILTKIANKLRVLEETEKKAISDLIKKI